MKPISSEQYRILRAAHERRFMVNDNGRFVIAASYLTERESRSVTTWNSPFLHEQRPDRRERERLLKRGCLKFRVVGEDAWWEPSAKGYQAMHNFEAETNHTEEETDGAG